MGGQRLKGQLFSLVPDDYLRLALFTDYYCDYSYIHIYKMDEDEKYKMHVRMYDKGIR